MPLKRPVTRLESLIPLKNNIRTYHASHPVMAGIDLVTVKELLGHKTIKMTNRYTHLAQEHKAQAVAKLKERYRVKR